jgi:hypothetical protein
MNKSIQKIVTLLIAVGLLAPSLIVLVQPKPTMALLSPFTFDITPTDTIVDVKEVAKETFLDALIKRIGTAFLGNLRKILYDWIQNDDAPLIITDWGDLFTNTLDSLIDELNIQTGNLICEPFQLLVDVQFQKSQPYQYEETIDCSLDDAIKANLDCALAGLRGHPCQPGRSAVAEWYDDFYKGGWKAWYSTAQAPGNDPLTVAKKPEEQYRKQIDVRRHLAETELLANSGFKSVRDVTRAAINSPGAFALQIASGYFKTNAADTIREADEIGEFVSGVAMGLVSKIINRISGGLVRPPALNESELMAGLRGKPIALKLLNQWIDQKEGIAGALDEWKLMIRQPIWSTESQNAFGESMGCVPCVLFNWWRVNPRLRPDAPQTCLDDAGRAAFNSGNNEFCALRRHPARLNGGIAQKWEMYISYWDEIQPDRGLVTKLAEPGERFVEVADKYIALGQLEDRENQYVDYDERRRAIARKCWDRQMNPFGDPILECEEAPDEIRINMPVGRDPNDPTKIVFEEMYFMAELGIVWCGGPLSSIFCRSLQMDHVLDEDHLVINSRCMGGWNSPPCLENPSLLHELVRRIEVEEDEEILDELYNILNRKLKSVANSEKIMLRQSGQIKKDLMKESFDAYAHWIYLYMYDGPRMTEYPAN